MSCNGSFCLASYGSRFGWDLKIKKSFFSLHFCNHAKELAAMAGNSFCGKYMWKRERQIQLEF